MSELPGLIDSFNALGPVLLKYFARLEVVSLLADVRQVFGCTQSPIRGQAVVKFVGQRMLEADATRCRGRTFKQTRSPDEGQYLATRTVD